MEKTMTGFLPVITQSVFMLLIYVTAQIPFSAHASAAECVHAVWQNLEACGWPGPHNTGYPAGQVFTKTVNGTYTVTVDNTIINGWRVTNGIVVMAKNVTIRNSWITSSFGTGLAVNGTGVINVRPGYSADIEHNLLDGRNGTHACVWDEGSSMTAKSNLCQNVNDGMFSWTTNTGSDGYGDNFDIEDNYFHNFTTLAANGHIDGYQTEGAKNGTIRHNTIDVTQNQNACFGFWNTRKSTYNIIVDNNLCAGGGFSAYAEDYNPSEASPYGGYSVTNVTFTNNKWSTVHYPCVGIYGVWYTRGAPTDGWNRYGNIVLETGQNIDFTDVKGCENPNDLTPPSTPKGLSATAVSNTQIALSWTPSSDNVGVTAYRVERCTGASCSKFAEVGVVSTAPPPPASYLDKGLASGTTYSYRVAAVDLRGNVSSYSATTTKTTLASATWSNSPFPSQSGNFTASFNATPDNNNADIVIGLSHAPAGAYSDLAAIVRFNDKGSIDVRNGGAYSSAVTLAYSANSTYHFRMVVSIPSLTYSVYVTTPGMTEVRLAANYAFRSEQAFVSSLANVGELGTAGNALITNFQIN